MNIEFIKWLVSYAEGFEIMDGVFIRVPSGCKGYPEDWVNNTVWQDLDYPLLIHRAVIGINEDEESNYDITLYPDSIEVGAYHDGTKDLTYEDVTNYEKGIEQALKYIYEQEAE